MNARGPKVQILIADDHRLFREGLRELLQEQPDFQVAGEAPDGQETLRLLDHLNPDILLLDLEMPRLSGMEVLKKLGGSSGHTRIIVLTALMDKPQIPEAFALGVRGLVLKEYAAGTLMGCIRAVMAGKYWILGEAVSDPSAISLDQGKAAKAAGAGNRYSLTARELEILSAIIAGQTNREIAEKFTISEQTVKHHLTHIFDKVGVYNRLELALFAIHHGVISARN